MREGLPQRKPLRLTEYDYGQAGVYFLTVCAKDNAPLFGHVCVGGGVLDAPHVELTRYGAAIETRLQEMDRVYGHISLLKYSIMPNHVHLLLQIGSGPSGTPAPTGRELEVCVGGGLRTPRLRQDRANQVVPAFVSTLKRMTNRACGLSLWQRGYHDHVVRNDADYLRIWSYIDTNPAKWAEDRYYIP